MKLSLIVLAATFGLLATSVQANENPVAQQITDQVWNTLEQQGDLQGLTSDELDDAKNATAIMVSDYLAGHTLNLGDATKYFSLKDAVAGVASVFKKLAEKMLKAVKNIAPQVLKALKAAATKGLEAAKKYGPKAVMAVKEIGDALGISSDVMFGIAFTAATNPVTPPGGVKGFMKALKKGVMEAIGTGATKQDVNDLVKEAKEDESDPEFLALLDEFTKA